MEQTTERRRHEVWREPANPGSGSGAGYGAGTPVEHGIALWGTVRWQAPGRQREFSRTLETGRAP